MRLLNNVIHPTRHYEAVGFVLYHRALFPIHYLRDEHLYILCSQHQSIFALSHVIHVPPAGLGYSNLQSPSRVCSLLCGFLANTLPRGQTSVHCVSLFFSREFYNDPERSAAAPQPIRIYDIKTSLSCCVNFACCPKRARRSSRQVHNFKSDPPEFLLPRS